MGAEIPGMSLCRATTFLLFSILIIVVLPAPASSTSHVPFDGVPTSRNLSEGILMAGDDGYLDQPYCVVENTTGCFVCAVTNASVEGAPGEAMVSLHSCNEGITWSQTSPVEATDPTKPSAYGTPIQSIAVPGRVYLVYNYNIQSVMTLPNGDALSRWDLVGDGFSMKWTEDLGKTWSTQRTKIHSRLTSIDRNNAWHGSQQMFWTVAKATMIGNTTIIPYAKVGQPIISNPVQVFFIRSKNLLTATDPSEITWDLLPLGDTGLMPPTDNLGEEPHAVIVEGNRVACYFRTIDGYIGLAYSNDAFETFMDPVMAPYDLIRQPTQYFKNPRGPIQVVRFSNNKYLMIFYNNGNTGYADRNPYWLVGGRVQDGFLVWSQPEIGLYEWDPAKEKNGPGYPDFIEFKGKYYITETQKVLARIHQIDPMLLKVLWDFHYAVVPSNGLVLSTNSSASSVPAPYFPTLAQGGAFSLGMWVKSLDPTSGQVILDNRGWASSTGFVLGVADNSVLEFAIQSDTFKPAITLLSDEFCGASLFDGQPHHIGIIVDGAPKVITLVIDDILCDGGNSSKAGWIYFGNHLDDINAYELLNLAPNFNGQLLQLRVYNRFLYTNEAIGIWRAERGKYQKIAMDPHHKHPISEHIKVV